MPGLDTTQLHLKYLRLMSYMSYTFRYEKCYISCAPFPFME